MVDALIHHSGDGESEAHADTDKLRVTVATR